MTETVKEKKRIFDFIYGLRQTAEKEGWVFRYDPETDEASVTTPKLSEDAHIHYVNDELALYFSKNKIQGLFIEYFSHNFIKHQPADYQDLKTMVKTITKHQTGDGLVELSWHKMEKIAPDLDAAIKFALIKDASLQT